MPTQKPGAVPGIDGDVDMATKPKKSMKVREASASFGQGVLLDVRPSLGLGVPHQLAMLLDREMTRAEEDAVLEAGARIARERVERSRSFGSPDDSTRFLVSQLAGLRNEVFAILFLDTRHRFLAFEQLFQGTIDGTEVHPRVVVERALHHGAAAAIVTHNHPSGDPEPSAADRAVTAQLKQVLSLIDVRLIDHIVVGGHKGVSLAARGWV